MDIKAILYLFTVYGPSGKYACNTILHCELHDNAGRSMDPLFSQDGVFMLYSTCNNCDLFQFCQDKK